MKRIVAICWLSCLVIAARAQEASTPVPTTLSYKEAVQIAIKNNYLLNQEKNNLELSQSVRANNVARLAPSVSSTFTALRIDGNSFNQNEGKVENGVRDNVYGSVDANLMLFNGFNRINTIRQSNDLLRAQTSVVKRTEQQVISDVSSQYLQVLLDQELLKIAERNIELLKAQLEQIKGQVELGAKAEVDGITQDALVKGAELMFLRARVTLRNDKALLSQTMLVDAAADYSLEDPQWDANFAASLDQNLDQLVATALANRADYQGALYTENAALHFVHATRATYYPNLVAFGSYGSAYNKLQGSAARGFRDQFFTDNTQLQYGLQLNIPIFNNLSNRLNVVRTKVAYNNAKLVRSNVENTVKNDVLKAYLNFQDAIAAYQAAEVQLHAAELSYNLEKERYDLGITDLVQYTQANQNYVKAQGDFAQSKFTITFQKILLDFAVGTLKFEDIP
ncbi:TolC family protein [Dawidia soli]|uniref:TolC family protein n=1 Tax=Dawidia soli TaxID=2782352 RepID=A0AAP2DBH2_9BACT|nr:TolC family protein [Dawidia soli]MBT1688951.1 TolC family protein [Dawidia soli]